VVCPNNCPVSHGSVLVLPIEDWNRSGDGVYTGPDLETCIESLSADQTGYLVHSGSPPIRTCDLANDPIATSDLLSDTIEEKGRKLFMNPPISRAPSLRIIGNAELKVKSDDAEADRLEAVVRLEKLTKAKKATELMKAKKATERAKKAAEQDKLAEEELRVATQTKQLLADQKQLLADQKKELKNAKQREIYREKANAKKKTSPAASKSPTSLSSNGCEDVDSNASWCSQEDWNLDQGKSKGERHTNAEDRRMRVEERTVNAARVARQEAEGKEHFLRAENILEEVSNHILAQATTASVKAQSTAEKKKAKTRATAEKRKAQELAMVEKKDAQAQAAAEKKETSIQLTSLREAQRMASKRAERLRKEADAYQLTVMRKLAKRSTKEMSTQKALYEALRIAHDGNNMKAELMQSIKTEVASLQRAIGQDTNQLNHVTSDRTPTAGGGVEETIFRIVGQFESARVESARLQRDQNNARIESARVESERLQRDQNLALRKRNRRSESSDSEWDNDRRNKKQDRRNKKPDRRNYSESSVSSSRSASRHKNKDRQDDDWRDTNYADGDMEKRQARSRSRQELQDRQEHSKAKKNRYRENRRSRSRQRQKQTDREKPPSRSRSRQKQERQDRQTDKQDRQNEADRLLGELFRKEQADTQSPRQTRGGSRSISRQTKAHQSEQFQNSSSGSISGSCGSSSSSSSSSSSDYGGNSSSSSGSSRDSCGSSSSGYGGNSSSSGSSSSSGPKRTLEAWQSGEVRDWLCQNNFKMFAELTEDQTGPFRTGRHLHACSEQDIQRIWNDSRKTGVGNIDIQIEARALRNAVVAHIAKYNADSSIN
jgi:hypothetical protein